MRTRFVCALDSRQLHRLAYHEWGDEDNPRVLVCVHGLARNGRDFDDLASALASDYRVICPDLAGRGDSDWLIDPEDYAVPQYLSDMVTLLARLNVERVDWVGTSLGGLIGICLASMPGQPINCLVLNDVGPFVPRQALERIGAYLQPHVFGSEEQALAYMKETYPSFVGLSATQWRNLARHNTRVRPDGTWVLHYDPAIGEQARKNSHADTDIRALWSRVRVPQLLFHGGESDVLPASVVEQMQQEAGSRLSVCEVPGIGHPPALMRADEIKLIRDWLLHV